MDSIEKIIPVNTRIYKQRLDITGLVEKALWETKFQIGRVTIFVNAPSAYIEIYLKSSFRISLHDAWNFLKTRFQIGRYYHGLPYRLGRTGHYLPRDFAIVIRIRGGDLELDEDEGIFLLEFNGPRKGMEVVCAITGKR